MIIFHMFEKLVLCPFHENARRPLRSALSFSPRRLRKADALLSDDVVSAHRSRSPNDRQTAPVFPHEPPSSDTPPRLPMSGKGRRKTKKRSRRPAITQKTQRCGRAAVFYPASGKNAESTCPETVGDRFRCITLTAGKTPCMPEPHAGIPDPSNRCRFRDFFNKTNKNCSSLRPSSCSNVSSKGKPIVFPGHPVHAHHTVLF